jgi:hypothetical protein
VGAKKNFGEQISDAIDDAINSADYSNLRATVEQTISQASRAVSAGISQAGAAAKQARAQQSDRAAKQYVEQEMRRLKMEQELAAQTEALERQREQQAREDALYAPVKKKRNGGIAGIVFGVLFVLSFISSFFDDVYMLAHYGSLYIGDVASELVFLALSALLLGWGVRRVGLIRRFQAYKYIIGLRAHVSVEELAGQTGAPVKNVLADLRKLITKGYFKQGHINDIGTVLMLTNDEYAAYRRGLEAARAYDREQAASAAASDTFANAKGQSKGKNAECVTGADAQASAPLPAEVQAILDRGQAFMAQIRASNAAIPGAEVTAKIDQIELVLQTIFARAQEHPEVVDDLDRLMNYYLPTTVKLLDAYRDLDAQPIQGENIARSKREIEGTLDALNVAFEKMLNQIFDDVAWDISTDVSVLHTVLAQEGLAAGPFDAAVPPSPETAAKETASNDNSNATSK